MTRTAFRSKRSAGSGTDGSPMAQGQGVRWVGQDVPAEAHQFLLGLQRCVWFGVVLMEHHTFAIDQFWALLGQGPLQFAQLATVDVRIDGLVGWQQLVIHDTLPIPPDTEHNLFRVESILRRRCWWFPGLGSGPLAHHVVVDDPFLVASDQPLQKSRLLVPIQQRMRDGHSVH